MFSLLWEVNGWRYVLALANKRVTKWCLRNCNWLSPPCITDMTVKFKNEARTQIRRVWEMGMAIFFFTLFWDNILLCWPTYFGLGLTMHPKVAWNLMIFLYQSSKNWDYRCAPLHLVNAGTFLTSNLRPSSIWNSVLASASTQYQMKLVVT